MAATTKTQIKDVASSLWQRNDPKEEKSKECQTETFPIPLRDDFVAKIELPRNFKKSEADKIGRVLAALADDDPVSNAPIQYPSRSMT